MITKQDIVWQVNESIAGSPDPETIDTAGVADEIVRVYGLVGIGSIDHDEYWAIVRRFDSTQADIRPGQSVAYVGDSTPDYLEYGEYRGWVLLAEDGTHERDMTEGELRSLPILWDEFINGDYAKTGTVSAAILFVTHTSDTDTLSVVVPNGTTLDQVLSGSCDEIDGSHWDGADMTEAELLSAIAAWVESEGWHVSRPIIVDQPMPLIRK